MRRKAIPRGIGRVPPARATVKLPATHTPTPHIPAAPVEYPAGMPPNPQRPRLVRDAHGGVLKDLFVLFPDLPTPPRPRSRKLPQGHIRHPGRRR
jgi:hypothetical protein